MNHRTNAENESAELLIDLETGLAVRGITWAPSWSNTVPAMALGEIDRLRAALERIASNGGSELIPDQVIAREALTPPSNARQ